MLLRDLSSKKPPEDPDKSSPTEVHFEIPDQLKKPTIRGLPTEGKMNGKDIAAAVGVSPSESQTSRRS